MALFCHTSGIIRLLLEAFKTEIFQDQGVCFVPQGDSKEQDMCAIWNVASFDVKRKFGVLLGFSIACFSTL